MVSSFDVVNASLKGTSITYLISFDLNDWMWDVPINSEAHAIAHKKSEAQLPHLVRFYGYFKAAGISPI